MLWPWPPRARLPRVRGGAREGGGAGGTRAGGSAPQLLRLATLRWRHLQVCSTCQQLWAGGKRASGTGGPGHTGSRPTAALAPQLPLLPHTCHAQRAPCPHSRGTRSSGRRRPRLRSPPPPPPTSRRQGASQRLGGCSCDRWLRAGSQVHSRGLVA